jgi:hypothetical protein
VLTDATSIHPRSLQCIVPHAHAGQIRRCGPRDAAAVAAVAARCAWRRRGDATFTQDVGDHRREQGAVLTALVAGNTGRSSWGRRASVVSPLGPVKRIFPPLSMTLLAPGTIRTSLACGPR